MTRQDKVEITQGKLKGLKGSILSYEPQLDMWWIATSKGKKMVKATDLKLIKE